MKEILLYFHIQWSEYHSWLPEEAQLVLSRMQGNERSEVSKVWSIPSHRGRHHEEIQKNNMGIIKYNDNQ